MAYEGGEMNHDEMIEFFQELLDSGLVWQLQGYYGRIATDLLKAGLIHHPPDCGKEHKVEKEATLQNAGRHSA